MKSVKQGEDSPVPIPVCVEDCLLHSLRMLPHQSTIHITESLAHAQFHEEALNIAGDKDYCLLVVILVQDAREKNITVFQLHSESDFICDSASSS